MSAFDYATAAADALELIREAGQSIQISRFTRVPDPVTGGVTISSVAVGNIDAAVLPMGKTDIQKLDTRLAEALIEGKLRKLIVAASTAPFEPAPLDNLYFEESYWIVRGNTPLNPAGTPVIYTIIVERGAISEAEVDALIDELTP